MVSENKSIGNVSRVTLFESPLDRVHFDGPLIEVIYSDPMFTLEGYHAKLCRKSRHEKIYSSMNTMYSARGTESAIELRSDVTGITEV